VDRISLAKSPCMERWCALRLQPTDSVVVTSNSRDRPWWVRLTLSDLLHDNAALTPEMALRIEKAFGPDLDHILRMQRVQTDGDCIGIQESVATLEIDRSRERRLSGAVRA